MFCREAATGNGVAVGDEVTNGVGVGGSDVAVWIEIDVCGWGVDVGGNVAIEEAVAVAVGCRSAN